MLSSELSVLYTRDLTRLIQQLAAFPDTATLWQTRAGITNSAGNLALHLEGNLREFIGRLMGKIDFTRDRPREFSDAGIEKAELVARVTAVRDVIPGVIAAMTAEDLDADFPQEYGGRVHSNRLMLIHLATHLSYHLGQIDYLRRVLTGEGAIPLADL